MPHFPAGRSGFGSRLRSVRARARESTLYVLIVLLLLFIATIVAAYFGARVWHWAHVTLGVFVFLAAVGYFILAAEVLRINAVLRKQVNQLQAELTQFDNRIEGLERGTSNSQLINDLAANEVSIPEDAEDVPSLSDIDHQLHLETRIRGEVWRGVVPVGFDPQTGTVTVTFPVPAPPDQSEQPAAPPPPAPGLKPDSIVFLFTQGGAVPEGPPRRPQYLGQFRVTQAAEREAQLVSVNHLDEVQRQRLASGGGPWAIHEVMPADRYELFAGLSEEQLRKLLPADTVGEYLRHGTPAGPNDDQWHRVGVDEEGNPLGPKDMAKASKVLYQRRLRDYALEFDELAEERVLLLADIAGVTKDNERLRLALASAQQLGAFREEEKRKLAIDLAGIEKEREIIEQHLATVERQASHARTLLNQVIAENRRLADELTRHDAQFRQRSSAAPVPPLALSQ